VENLAKVISQPALGQDDIRALKEKIKTTHAEVEEITNRRNVKLIFICLWFFYYKVVKFLLFVNVKNILHCFQKCIFGILKVSNDPMEDKLTLFRQQAAIIARKKDSTAEKLNDVRVEFAAIEDEIKDKKSGKQYGYFF
jgi:hypothetical protein